MDLVQQIYVVTACWPRDELSGLTSQIRRAAVSVPSNIAEGRGRASKGEFLNHLGIAYGSLMEVETHLLIAQRLGYVCDESANGLGQAAAEVGRLVNGLAHALSKT
jgi:four helix bundle protein